MKRPGGTSPVRGSFHRSSASALVILPLARFTLRKLFAVPWTALTLDTANNRFTLDVSKDIAFEEECKVFEVCNPAQAAKVLSLDMLLNMALPCRISVFTEKGVTRIGMIRPVPMLSALSQDTSLASVAQEVEEKMSQMIDETK